METVSERDFFEFENRIIWKDGYDAPKTLVGIFFGRPELEIVDREILPSLLYYHIRSADYLDFYFAGYQRASQLDGISDDGERGWWASYHEGVLGKNFYRIHKELDWYFCVEDFDQIRTFIEKRSRWVYSGGVELLLLNLVYSEPNDHFYLDFSSILILQLDSIRERRVVQSLGMLFEKIFQYSENQRESDPVGGLSDFLGLKSATTAFKAVALAFLPKNLGQELEKVATFAVRDLRT